MDTPPLRIMQIVLTISNSKKKKVIPLGSLKDFMDQKKAGVQEKIDEERIWICDKETGEKIKETRWRLTS